MIYVMELHQSYTCVHKSWYHYVVKSCHPETSERTLPHSSFVPWTLSYVWAKEHHPGSKVYISIIPSHARPFSFNHPLNEAGDKTYNQRSQAKQGQIGSSNQECNTNEGFEPPKSWKPFPKLFPKVPSFQGLSWNKSNFPYSFCNFLLWTFLHHLFIFIWFCFVLHCVILYCVVLFLVQWSNSRLCAYRVGTMPLSSIPNTPHHLFGRRRLLRLNFPKTPPSEASRWSEASNFDR